MTKNITPTSIDTALPFEVRLAQSDRELSALCAIRAEAYSRHEYTQEQVTKLSALDDSDVNAFLLIVEDKKTKEIVGTKRIRSTKRGGVELNVHYPRDDIGEKPSFIYADRLGIQADYPHVDLAVLGLFKAGWYLGMQENVDWLLASALRPLVRRYRRAGILPLKGGEAGFPMSNVHPDLYYPVGARVKELPLNVMDKAPQCGEFYFGGVSQRPEAACARAGL